MKNMLLAVSLLVSVGLQAPKYYKSAAEVFGRRTGWTAGGGLTPNAIHMHVEIISLLKRPKSEMLF